MIRVLNDKWMDSREIYTILKRSGYGASYYQLRVCLDGLQLRGAVEVRREELPWPGKIEVKRKKS